MVLTDDIATVGERRYTGALSKAAEMIDALEMDLWLSASDLAARLSIDRSTAYRLAQALTRLGWLRWDNATKRYGLGLRLWELGARAIADLDVRRIALPYMRDVVARTGESCDLAILDGAHIVYVEVVPGTHEIRAATQLGERVPAHAVAMGKALLAYVPPEERARRLPNPLPRFTSKTVRTLDEVNARCDEVLQRGYAINLGEHNPEAGGMAVPILDREGKCVGAVGINVPAARMTPAYIDTLAPILLEAGRSVSRELGSSLSRPEGGGE